MPDNTTFVSAGNGGQFADGRGHVEPADHPGGRQIQAALHGADLRHRCRARSRRSSNDGSSSRPTRASRPRAARTPRRSRRPTACRRRPTSQTRRRRGRARPRPTPSTVTNQGYNADSYTLSDLRQRGRRRCTTRRAPRRCRRRRRWRPVRTTTSASSRRARRRRRRREANATTVTATSAGDPTRVGDGHAARRIAVESDTLARRRGHERPVDSRRTTRPR